MQVDLDNEIRLRKERVLTLKAEIKQLEETRTMLIGPPETAGADDEPEKQNAAEDE
jgi:hypothetical protein